MNGEISQKRGGTLVATLRETHWAGSCGRYRSDMTLETLLEREGVEPLSQYLRKDLSRAGLLG